MSQLADRGPLVVLVHYTSYYQCNYCKVFKMNKLVMYCVFMSLYTVCIYAVYSIYCNFTAMCPAVTQAIARSWSTTWEKHTVSTQLSCWPAQMSSTPVAWSLTRAATPSLTQATQQLWHWEAFLTVTWRKQYQDTQAGNTHTHIQTLMH